MFSAESVRNQLIFGHRFVFMLTRSVVRILREVPITRVVVLFLIIVPLDVVRRMIDRVFVMISASGLVEVIVG